MKLLSEGERPLGLLPERTITAIGKRNLTEEEELNANISGLRVSEGDDLNLTPSELDEHAEAVSLQRDLGS